MSYLGRIYDHPKYKSMPGYWERHVLAIRAPKAGPEQSIVGLLSAWLHYADAHFVRFESTIGEDGFLGPIWETIGRSIRGLLNGETGRLDCGAIDSLILNVLAAEGFKEE